MTPHEDDFGKEFAVPSLVHWLDKALMVKKEFSRAIHFWEESLRDHPAPSADDPRRKALAGALLEQSRYVNGNDHDLLRRAAAV